MKLNFYQARRRAFLEKVAGGGEMKMKGVEK